MWNGEYVSCGNTGQGEGLGRGREGEGLGLREGRRGTVATRPSHTLLLRRTRLNWTLLVKALDAPSSENVGSMVE